MYVDTGPGGTNSLYHPAGTGSGTVRMSLTAMQADALVWVQDAHTAALLEWDGGAWVRKAALSDDQFHFDAGRLGGQTDLYLPFELLGYDPGSSLGLLAVAAEEPEAGRDLQLWATLPQFNPVNSRLVNRMLSFMPAGAELALKHAFRWGNLGPGACPNDAETAHYGDVDPQLSIQADPSGVGLSGLGRGLFWVDGPGLDAPGLLEQVGLHFVAPAHPAVDPGQTVHYTARYRNAGTETQHGVLLALTGYGVSLASETVDLGDVGPGAEVQANFEGEVTGAGPNGAWAAVKGVMHDAAHPDGEALEWLVMVHRVDQGPPDAVSITGVGTTVGPRTALGGLAHDESGVASVEVEIQGPGGTAKITCPVDRTGEGRWQCPWNELGRPAT